MKYRAFYSFLLVLIVTQIALVSSLLIADPDSIKNGDILATHFDRSNAVMRKRSSTPKVMKFNYTDEDLIDIINAVAAQKLINIILPTGANAITTKATIHLDHLIDVDEAWDILLSLLDLADYSMIAKDSTYTIVKNNPQLSKEPAPLYVGVPPAELPDNDERIRYLYYLANIKVTEDDAKGMIQTLLRDLLPANALIKVDVKTNAILLSDKANNIKSVMNIVTTLDQITFKENLEIIKLRYTSADIIAKLFMDTILAPEKDKSRYRLESGKQQEAGFFSRNVKIIPEIRTNSLVVLGREQAINQVKDFINKYLDVELDSGKSILHVYQLQYLDAATVEPVLIKIVQSALTGGNNQSRGTQTQTGPERFFEDVRIKADAGKAGSLSYSGNKLIIAAKHDDWIIIKQLLEELDKPQRTVIIEVLVADLTLQDQKLLGASLRNPAGLPFPNGVSFQTVQITPTFVRNTGTFPPTPASSSTLATDLLAPTLPAPGGGTTSFANLAQPGSTVVSFNDNNGQTWGIGQILKILQNSKVLSHPHVIAMNNKTAFIKVGQWRLLPDQASAGTAATTITFSAQEANIKVTMTPRISTTDLVNLQIKIEVNDWIAGNARITRTVDTNANVKSEDILALGGLIRTDSIEGLNETPVLASIPLIGWLFKRRSSDDTKTNLTVFISPTIIEPRLRSGVGDYTKDYIKVAKKYSFEGELFDNLRDPVTRFFFGTTDEAQETVDKFLQKDEFKRDIMHLNEQVLEPGDFIGRDKKFRNVAASMPIAFDTQKHADELKKILAQEENPLLRS